MTGSFMDRRQAEMEAGRRRFEERASQPGLDPEEKRQMQELRKMGEAQLEEDEERLRAINSEPSVYDKALRDRAGAEVADQAQTELEALQHTADQEEKIIERHHELQVELMKHPTADPALAEELTDHHVTAQAVNQPTVLAHEMDGADTENKPLNQTGMRERDLAVDRVLIPDDNSTPKTRKKAEKVAAAKIPPAKEVVREGAIVSDDAPEKNRAVPVVERKPDIFDTV